MDERKLLERITVNPKIFGGKPIIRGRRLAVEHVLGMLGAGDSIETILEGYPWLEREDVQACLIYASRLREGFECTEQTKDCLAQAHLIYARGLRVHPPHGTP
ncbi:MAG TPA: DUF433 domain-containing protein [Gemmataceae bacterium]|nr:DUF433 domain-containing protein [Gemmataceae bacterium]